MRNTFATLLLYLTLTASPAHADGKPVDVALVLAPDVSGSVSEESWRLQRDGMSAAIASKQFHDVVSSGPIGRIAVSVVQWSGIAFVSMPWRIIESKADAQAVSVEIAKLARIGGGLTCIDTALNKAIELLALIEDRASRQVIDISGDGAHNCPEERLYRARQAALRIGATINGLPIVTPLEAEIEDWYARNLIGGPGAFTVAASGFDNFEEAFLKKVTSEIAELR